MKAYGILIALLFSFHTISPHNFVSDFKCMQGVVPVVVLSFPVIGAVVTQVASALGLAGLGTYLGHKWCKKNKSKVPAEIDTIAYNDAQVPGMPTEEDGYFPPKNWDDKKVKNPNGPGMGWPDKNGHVWVPTGPHGHGGPHWDVQDPKTGRHRNILPGGRER